MRELKKSFWDLTAVFGTNIIAIPLMLLSESFQAKYLGPSNYGKVALILSVIYLLDIIGLNWLRLAMMRFGKEEFTKHNCISRTVANFLVITLFSFIIISSIFVLFRQFIFNFLEIKYIYAFWIIITGLFLTICKQFIFEVLKVIRLIKIQAFLFRLASKIFILGGILFLVYVLSNINVYYIIIVFLLTDLIIIIIGICFINSKYIFPLQFDKIMIKKMIIFSFPLLFSSWSGYIIDWIDTYVIKYFMSMEDVGIYQASYKIFNTFKSFTKTGLITITTSIIIVFKTNDQIDKIKIYIERLLPQISFFMMIIIAFLNVFSDIAFIFIYGEEFRRSIIPFKILITSQNFGIIASLFTGIIIGFDMTKMILYMGVFSAVFNLFADIILVQYFGIIGAAIASFLVFSIVPVIWLFYINKKFNIRRKLALLYPIISIIIMLINILMIDFIIKLLVSIFLIIIVFFISRRFNLFNKKDSGMINNISLPESIKKLCVKFINYASEK